MSSAMRQLEERHVANKVELMVWSNKLDLLALSNVKGEVSLHRLTWQRVWCLPPPSEGTTVRGMAWRPDGKVIAIAYSTNEIMLIDVENKDMLHQIRMAGDVNLVSWVQEHESNTKEPPAKTCWGDPGEEGFLPPLPSLSRDYSPACAENLGDSKKIRGQTQLNILMVGLATGHLYLNIFGLFPCCVLDLHQHLPGKCCSVIDASISADLGTLAVVLVATDPEGGNYRELVIVVMDTPTLHRHSRQLHTLALKHGHIFSLLGYLSQTMTAITEAWENILLEMDTKLSAYASKVPVGSVSADFLDLLMFGTATDELEMFLLRDLTEKGLKKLGHSVELSYANIQKLVLKHVQSAGGELAYHLGELGGMARLGHCYGALGLEEETVGKARMSAGSFLAKASEMQQVIDESMRSYKAFFRWLYAAILRLSDERVPPEMNRLTQQEIAFIADFLASIDRDVVTGGGSPDRLKPRPVFSLDRLGQYLAKGNLTTTQPDTEWNLFLMENPCLAQQPTIVPHHKETSLLQAHIQLQQAIEAVFKEPEACIGRLFSLSRLVSCTDIPPNIRVCHTSLESSLLLALLPGRDSPLTHGLHFLEVPTGKDEPTDLQLRCGFLQFPASKWVIDLQFYLPETLSVLLEERNDSSRSTWFLQLPTASLQHHSRCATVSQGLPLSTFPTVDSAGVVAEPGAIQRPVESMVASRFAVSGMRKVAVVLSESRRKVRLFEMEAEEEEEDEESTLDSSREHTTRNSSRD